MMKRRGAVLFVASIICFASWGRADTPVFDRVFAGADLGGLYGGISALYLTSSDWDDGYGVGVEAGYRFAHEQAAALRHGNPAPAESVTVRVAGRSPDPGPEEPPGILVRMHDAQGRLLGVGLQDADGIIRPRRLFIPD